MPNIAVLIFQSPSWQACNTIDRPRTKRFDRPDPHGACFCQFPTEYRLYGPMRGHVAGTCQQHNSSDTALRPPSKFEYIDLSRTIGARTLRHRTDIQADCSIRLHLLRGCSGRSMNGQVKRRSTNRKRGLNCAAMTSHRCNAMLCDVM